MVRRAVPSAVGSPKDWRERFIRAYDIEFQEWIDAIAGDGAIRSQLVGRLRRRGRVRCGRRGAARRLPGRHQVDRQARAVPLRRRSARPGTAMASVPLDRNPVMVVGPINEEENSQVWVPFD